MWYNLTCLHSCLLSCLLELLAEVVITGGRGMALLICPMVLTPCERTGWDLFLYHAYLKICIPRAHKMAGATYIYMTSRMHGIME